jgi:hypothetical protein
MLAASGFGVFLIFIFFLFFLASLAIRAQKKLQEQQTRLSQRGAAQRPATQTHGPRNAPRTRPRRPPALPKQPAAVQSPAPVPAPVQPLRPMVSLSRNAAATGMPSRISNLRLNPRTLREQYILIELFQPPLALRDDSRP